jgi:hypothetical protein
LFGSIQFCFHCFIPSLLLAELVELLRHWLAGLFRLSTATHREAVGVAKAMHLLKLMSSTGLRFAMG